MKNILQVEGRKKSKQRQSETKNQQHILFLKQTETTHRRLSLIHFLLRTSNFIMLYILQVVSIVKCNLVLLPIYCTVS